MAAEPQRAHRVPDCHLPFTPTFLVLSYNLDIGRDLTCTAVDEGPDLIRDDEAEEGTVWNSARYPVEVGSPVPESHRCGEIDVSAPVSGIPRL